MEKLVEFLTSKIGYTIAIIGGLLFPGLIFIFVWDREFFVNINTLVLFVFATAISFMIYVPNIFFWLWCHDPDEKTQGKKDTDKVEMLMIPLMMAFAEMSIAMIFRLNDESFSILKLVVHLLMILFGAGIILNVKRKIIYFLKKRKK